MNKFLALCFLFISAAVFAGAQGSAVFVFTAAKDIKRGAQVLEEDVVAKPTKITQRDSFITMLKEDKKSSPAGKGFYALVDIPKGAQLGKNMLTKKQQAGYSALVPPQWRLYPLKVTGADFGLFSKDSYCDISIVKDGAFHKILASAAIAYKEEISGAYYLFFRLDQAAAQQLYLLEYTRQTLNLTLVKSPR